ncbi:Phosphoheptose isomerase [Fundidesulfovibrio magnetotacticus]|uniref:Phosphoheptose isomerase n=1 Tax=Fundidesulfovibrio magnetotacticus TaxID=2730080 RepID=A0A6V8LYB8_9BACT|nr:D-sedoheptulose 7-phosphate isomerase [Fundidesulfovibrio magnetotacticus]GFK93265.1 Phosphoheptose isomerase [Fundidesulfovibrio magnetotacticus]
MSTDALEIVHEHAREGAQLRERFFRENGQAVVAAGRTLALCLAKGGKILFCGNGGSAADAQHLAAEFVNRFQLERPPLPALALTTDTSVLTAIGNDYGFDQVFSKQVQALGRPGDVLVGISTSGNSPNVVAAMRLAREKGLTTIGMAGKNGEIVQFSDLALLVPHGVTAMVQEIHIACGHLLCKLADHYLFEAVMELKPYLDAAP